MSLRFQHFHFQYSRCADTFFNAHASRHNSQHYRIACALLFLPICERVYASQHKRADFVTMTWAGHLQTHTPTHTHAQPYTHSRNT